MDIFFTAVCLTIGVVSGFLGGLFGIGGGIVIVPALALFYEIYDRIPAEFQLLVSVGTSLACIGFTSASAAWTQHRAGFVNWHIFKRLVGFLLLGSFAAGFIAPLLPEVVFRTFIGLFLFAVATIMLSKWQPAPGRQFPGLLGTAGLGLGGGTTAGLVGIAGGNVIVPSLVFLNVPVHRATATASALGVPIAIVGASGYAISSLLRPPAHPAYIDWLAIVPIVLGAVVMAPLGVKVAHRLQPLVLKRAFAVLLAVVSMRILYGVLD